jgi:formylglycine-generating enzyme required for sulfatase activity
MKFLQFNIASWISFIGLIVLSACTHSSPMVQVPEGEFTMGFVIENDESWGDVDEEPVHKVFLDTFWIDAYEASAEEFSEFLNANLEDATRFFEPGPAVTIVFEEGKYRPREGLENYPANRISWYGASSYCNWKGKRLPTEAEWEKAARGTDERIFPWGNEFPTNERVTFRRKFSEYKFKAMEKVDALPLGKSPYGAHHMAGNVWEWVADWYSGDYYSTSPERNPQGPDEGDSKVLRGGNWYYKAYYMRTTYRFNDPPEIFKVWQGVRCAKTSP